ncbi:hypothetical protein TURU_083465 [Turdus rufiventris]|nr:hypothetical protein TURU_083465 [Turdus rufiventris]
MIPQPYTWICHGMDTGELRLRGLEAPGQCWQQPPTPQQPQPLLPEIELIPCKCTRTQEQLELTPGKRTQKQLELTPGKRTQEQLELTPCKRTQKQLELTPGKCKRTQKQLELTPGKRTQEQLELTPCTRTQKQLELTPCTRTQEQLELTPCTRTQEQLELTPGRCTRALCQKGPAKGLCSSVAPRDSNCCKQGKRKMGTERGGCSDSSFAGAGSSPGHSTRHGRAEVSSWGMDAGEEQTVISPLNLPSTN